MDMMKAMAILSLKQDVAFSAVDLKTAFRRACFFSHPDRPGADGSSDAFVELQEAHKFLLPMATESKKALGAKTASGIPLSELGKGYPLNVSARPCDGCKGEGYKEYQATERMDWVECTACGGSALVNYPCNRCNGTGKYTNPRTGKESGECYTCRGTGRFYPKLKRGDRYGFLFGNPKCIPGTRVTGIPCRSCEGLGEKQKAVKSGMTYMRCDECKGIGEVEIWNPVIPRGFLSAVGGR